MTRTVRLHSATARPRAEVEGFLASLPGVERDAGLLLYSDEDLGLEAEIRPAGSEADVRDIEVSVPEPVSQPAAEALAAFCTSLARHFGWDAQNGADGRALDEGGMLALFTGSALAPFRRTGCLGAFLAALPLLLLPQG